MIPGGHLAITVHILMVSSDDEAHFEVEVPQILRDMEDHSFIGGEGTNSNSKVKMPPKFFKLPSKQAKKKSKTPDPTAPVPTLVAPKLHSSPCPKKGKGKVADMGTSYKRRHGIDANSAGISLLTSSIEP